ncbi:MAG: hypothetical protein FWC69_00395 [Defluviitaleaceae bacterium]|nr:hypothetical protein [Defluviitaleaceae bacterium]
MCREEMGEEKEVFHKVFLYRLNAAVSFLLSFITLQMFVGTWLSRSEVPTYALVVSGAMFVVALAYVVFAVNAMLTRIIVYENGLEQKSLFRSILMPTNKIKRVSILRKDMRKLKITIYLTDEKNVVIDAIRYKDSQPLVDFCAELKG